MADDGILVLGAGGHAKVVVSTLTASGIAVSMVLDDDPTSWGGSVLGIPVSGPIDRCKSLGRLQSVIAVGENGVRRRLAEVQELDWITAIHPRAWVHPGTSLGPGTVVFAGAVVQPDTVVGGHAILNTGATIDHDCRIGDFAHLGPGASLAGGVEVGEGAFLGIKSAALPGVRIGAWSTVGAGAIVVDDVPDGATVMGVPAR